MCCSTNQDVGFAAGWLDNIIRSTDDAQLILEVNTIPPSPIANNSSINQRMALSCETLLSLKTIICRPHGQSMGTVMYISENTGMLLRPYTNR